jgi:predicted GNAT superfamily acetyltransferase
VIAIRETLPTDLSRLLAINNANVPEVNELDAAEIARLHGWSIASLVAEESAGGTGTPAIAGFCMVYGPGEDYASLNYRWFSERNADFAYLDRIAVDAAHRRKGIGRRFYEELVGRLRGVRPVLLCEVNVQPRNDASLAFHREIGFHEVGQQDTDSGKRVSLLELPLA